MIRKIGVIMIIQLSSGQGPAECELAVSKLFDALKKEYPDIKYLSGHTSRYHEGYTSILLETERDLSGLEGSVQWICRSPYRPNHKRKNWFVDVSIIPEIERVDDSEGDYEDIVLCRDEDIRFERFHCSGKGGQNVNKVETGVRLIHIPTGITVTSTAERSQYMNKKAALKKLNAILAQMAEDRKSSQKQSAWSEHTKIVRGNPVRIYKGLDFRLKCDSRGV